MCKCCKLRPLRSLSAAAPKISIMPNSPRAMRNHSLLLQCSSNSSQVPTFTWKHNSTEITSGLLFSVSSDGHTSSLYVDKFNDSFLGEYACMASDKVHGLQQASVEVQLSTEIYLLRPLENQTEFEGSSLKVECAVDGGVNDTIVEWRKDDSVLRSSPGVTLCSEPDDCVPYIRFDKLAVSNEGNYSCVVHDSEKSKKFSFLIIVYSEFLCHGW